MGNQCNCTEEERLLCECMEEEEFVDEVKYFWMCDLQEGDMIEKCSCENCSCGEEEDD